jgi:hypothetical protein
MAEILNIQDRSKSFWKFFLFFLVTILVIITAVFFDFRMPRIENQKLREEVRDQRLLSASQERFATKLEDVVLLMDSLDKERNPAMASQLKGSVESELKRLADLNPYQEEGTSYGKLNRIVIQRLYLLHDNFRKFEVLRKDLADKEKALTDCNARTLSAQNQIPTTQ